MLAHDAAQCLGFQRVFGEVTPGKFDGAAVCPGLTGQDTYGRCLSGSVRSEIGHKFPIDRLRRLQEVVASLENGELPLEDSVRLYKEGLTLSRSCREQLEKARNEVRLLTEEGLEPFDEKKLDEEGE